jgi:hypothetical protein
MLDDAKLIVTEWTTLPTNQKEFQAKSEFKNKTLNVWNKEVETLENQKEKDENHEELARGAFVRNKGTFTTLLQSIIDESTGNTRSAKKRKHFPGSLFSTKEVSIDETGMIVVFNNGQHETTNQYFTLDTQKPSYSFANMNFYDHIKFIIDRLQMVRDQSMYLKDFITELKASIGVSYDEAYAINVIPPNSYCVVASTYPDGFQIKLAICYILAKKGNKWNIFFHSKEEFDKVMQFINPR